MNNNHTFQTLVFAHRGANREAAENTRLAFDRALQYPIDGMETDIQLSKDEITVLWHDCYTDKLGYPNQHIDDFNYSELERMNFAAHFQGSSQAEGVLSLEELLERYRKRCKLQIEIKNRDWEALERQQLKVRQTLELLDTAKDMDVFISSFHLESMIYANKVNSDIPLFYSFDETQGLAELVHVLKAHDFLAGLCLPIDALNEKMMGHLRMHDKKVLTYTCNTDLQINKALDLKVDVLITDDVQKALRYRGADEIISH